MCLPCDSYAYGDSGAMITSVDVRQKISEQSRSSIASSIVGKLLLTQSPHESDRDDVMILT